MYFLRPYYIKLSQKRRCFIPLSSLDSANKMTEELERKWMGKRALSFWNFTNCLFGNFDCCKNCIFRSLTSLQNFFTLSFWNFNCFTNFLLVILTALQTVFLELLLLYKLFFWNFNCFTNCILVILTALLNVFWNFNCFTNGLFGT